MRIRLAVPDDVDRIAEIYNEAVLTTTATFDLEPKTQEQMMAWFVAHDDRHPIFVADVEGLVVGWASLSEYSDRCAYRNTTETSYYVKEEYRGQGIGHQLNQELIQRACQLGFRSLIARVAEGSEASLRLLRRSGFQHVGTLRQVGEKFGLVLDVHILQKLLKS